VPTALIDGIATRYEVTGSGPPLLLLAPGGFDATLEKWRTLGIYARTRPLDHLAPSYTCIAFDRRECGESGGRVERIAWTHYVAQAAGLLDHLGIERAHLMGGCMGCCPVTAFAAAHPARALSMILWWPVGGARYRLRGEQRFAAHRAFVAAEGLTAVVERARAGTATFGSDPAVGPWAAVIRRDAGFAHGYAGLDVAAYLGTLAAMAHNLLDRDTAPGAPPEALMRTDVPTLIVPGRDESHATSAARYLEECLPRARYWDAAVEAQTESASASCLLDFLATAATP